MARGQRLAVLVLAVLLLGPMAPAQANVHHPSGCVWSGYTNFWSSFCWVSQNGSAHVRRANMVTAVQRQVGLLGFSPGGIDGTFGPATRSAVMAYQASRGLGADGVVGSNTWTRLNIDRTFCHTTGSYAYYSVGGSSCLVYSEHVDMSPRHVRSRNVANTGWVTMSTAGPS